MTAKEARQLTKAALVNTPIMQNLDKDIAKAAKQGNYSVKSFFTSSDGCLKSLTEVERDAMCEHYSSLGFDVAARPNASGKYEWMIIDWSKEREQTGGAIIVNNNVD